MTHLLRIGDIFDPDGSRMAFARVDVYESGENGRHIVGVVADEHGRIPDIEVETGKLVRVVCRAADGPLMFSWDDLQVPSPDKRTTA